MKNKPLNMKNNIIKWEILMCRFKGGKQKRSVQILKTTLGSSNPAYGIRLSHQLALFMYLRDSTKKIKDQKFQYLDKHRSACP